MTVMTCNVGSQPVTVVGGNSSAMPGTDSAGPGLPQPVDFHYTQTESFVAVLQQLGATMLVSTYQANKLLAVRSAGAGLSTLVRTFDRPMGLAVREGQLAMGTRREVWTLWNAADIAPQLEPTGTHDACFLPRSSHVTGDIGIHDLAWSGDELWMVNTRFSCLATLDPRYSFVPRWRPPFVSALAAEDRCHLNGLAMVDGRPRFVTALGTSDTPQGWRAHKSRGGCIVDVARNQVIATGLSMPHSPRWHHEGLWVLESGTGALMNVDHLTGRMETIARLPGFARGMVLADNYAFIGLSKIRKSSTMDGVPIATRRDELKCGIAVVDLRSGETAAFLEFQTAVEEVFDVQILPGLRFPEIMGFQKETLQNTFVIPAGR